MLSAVDGGRIEVSCWRDAPAHGVLSDRPLQEVVELKRTLISLVLLGAVVSTTAVRADIAPQREPISTSITASLAVESGAQSVTSANDMAIAGQLIGFDQAFVPAHEPGDLTFADEGHVGTSLTIDGPPSSIGLFLSGLMTVGAWHLGRSVGKWHPHIGSLPEWYHDGGPLQVGHAVPFDFHSGLATVHALESAAPTDIGPRITLETGRGAFVPILPHFVHDPVRGPPR